MRPTPVAVPHTKTGTQEEEMGQDSLLVEGSTDVCLVECPAESEQMSPDTTEAAMQEVEIMDVEPQGETDGELVGLDTQAPSPQAHPQAVKGSTNEEMARNPGADGSLIEKDAVAEEPVVEVPQPGRSQQWSALPQCTHGPLDP